MAVEALDFTTQVVSEAFETLETDSHAEDGKYAGIGPVACDPGSAKKLTMDSPRAEIDTSVPFLSVKEAANRFGGMGFWRPLSHKHSECEFEAVEEIKLKLQKDASKVSATLNANLDGESGNPSLEVAEEKENHENLVGGIYNCNGALRLSPSSAPGFILMELKQAKLNLTRASDLFGIPATVQSFRKKIEIERLALEKTRRRLSLKSSKISSLEEEVNKTRLILQMSEDSDIKDDSNNPNDISRKLQQLSSEAEKYRKIGEAGKTDVLRAMSAIEHTKIRIKTAEMKLVAAKKMKEAARATEALALAEIKAISKNEQVPKGVTLSYKEYTSLVSKAREAEEASKRKLGDTMLLVDEAKISKMEILKMVEEATEQVKISEKVLEEALDRVEAANRAKLAVEEGLRKWRSENSQRRRSMQNSRKFKNPSCSSHSRKDPSRLFDVDRLNLLNDDFKPVLRPKLSIGQILSRKLFLTEEFGNGMKSKRRGAVKRKMSLGQMLNRPNCKQATGHKQKAERETGHKQPRWKRKKLGFPLFSVLKRKKNQAKEESNC